MVFAGAASSALGEQMCGLKHERAVSAVVNSASVVVSVGQEVREHTHHIRQCIIIEDVY